MNEIYLQFLELANSVFKRRWAALLMAWVVCLAGWTFVVSRPNVYTASTRLYIDTGSVLQPLLKGLAIEEAAQPELEVLKRSLTSRSNLEKVARMTDLDLMATTPSQMERLLDSLRGRTRVVAEGASVISISYSDLDPVRARDVVSGITDIFIESNLGQNREEIEGAQIFLDRQIEQYERALEAAERRLADFKEEKLSILPNKDNYQFRIEELRSEIDDAEASLERARVRRAELRQTLNEAPVSDTAAQIFEAEQELNDLRTRFTERHPDVVALRRKIDVLREMNEASADKLDGMTRGRPVNQATGGSQTSEGGANYSNLRLELSRSEADVAAYADKVERLKQQLERFRSLAARVPETEVELAKLNRDYDVLKIKHSELLSRREQAKISRDRDLGADRTAYEILDAARVPAIPDGPPRAVMIIAVFVASLIAGVGFAVLLSFTNTAFNDPKHLREAFGIAVLGTVSMVHSHAQRGWQVAKLSSFAGCLLLLVVSLGALLYADRTLEIDQLRPSELGRQGIDAVLSLVGTEK